MPSFDIISEVNQVEVRNAVDQVNKEVSTRFDFKGSDSRVEVGDKLLTVFADDGTEVVLIGRGKPMPARMATMPFFHHRYRRAN